MIQGSRIVAGQDGGGFRDFLDERPIQAGDGLELWAAGHWLPGRYEFSYHSQTCSFHTSLFDPSGNAETAIRIDRATMRFRWPPSAPDDDMAEQLTRATQATMQLRSDLREVRAIVRRALDDEQENADEAHAERLRYALLDIRMQVESALS